MGVLSQDEACFPVMATLAAVLRCQGLSLGGRHEGLKDMPFMLAVVNDVTATVPSTTLEGPA